MTEFASRLAMFTRRLLLPLAAAIVIASYLWVLTRPWRMADELAGRIELVVLHWGDQNEDRINANLIAEFLAQPENRDIRVKRINAGGAAAVTTKLQTMVAAGTPPDVFQVDYQQVANYVMEDVLADFDELIEMDRAAAASDALVLEDFFPAVLDCFRHDGLRVGSGRLYALPKDFTTVGFYYNADLFRRAGVPLPPAEGWTWEEFHDAARRIGELPGCYGADFPTWEAIIRVYLFGFGVDVATPGWDRFTLDDPVLRDALRRLQGWFHREPRTLASAKTQLETGQEPFLTGRIGMSGPLGRWKVPTYRLIDDFDWDFAPLPHAEGHPPANGVLTSAWSIAAQSKKKHAAWRLVKFLVGPRGQALNSSQGLAIPALKSVAYGPDFVDPTVKPANDRVYLDMAEHAQPIEWPAEPKYLHALRIALENIFKLDKDVDAEMDTAARVWEGVRARELARGPMPWGVIWTAVLLPLGGAALIGAAFWWRGRPGRIAQREEIAGLLMVSPWVIGFLAFTAYPVLASAMLAFSQWSGLRPLSEAQAVGWENFARMLGEDDTLLRSLYVTVLYVLLAVPTSQAFALGAALLMARNVKGQGVFRSLWYLPSVLAGVGLAVMWKWVFHHEHGLLNDLLNPILAWFSMAAPRWLERDAESWGVPAFVIMNLWAIGGTMMIYLAGIKGIPGELYEAAAIDGASPWRRFLNVTLPMLSPVIFFNGIIAIIASFQVFTQAYVMTGGGPGDATRFYVLYLYQNAFDLKQMGYASAMAWVLLMIVLALTLAVMRGSRRFVYYEALR